MKWCTQHGLDVDPKRPEDILYLSGIPVGDNIDKQISQSTSSQTQSGSTPLLHALKSSVLGIAALAGLHNDSGVEQF